MVATVSSSLIQLAGLAASPAEPHVPNGNHLRVLHHPLLGVPVAPFILQRAVLAPGTALEVAFRKDVLFRNKDGRVLLPPFEVTKEDEIRATIAVGATTTCIWAGLLALAPGRSTYTMQPRNYTVGPRADARPQDAIVSIFGRYLNNDPSIAKALEDQGGGLVVQAFGPAVDAGQVSVGVRQTSPYTFSAPSIVELLITGTGTVAGLVWLAAQDITVADWETCAVLNLPRRAGRRYISVTDPEARAEANLRMQAPKLWPLHELASAVPPSAAPAFSAVMESDRVQSLAAALMTNLDALIDGPALPLQAAAPAVTLTNSVGQPLARGAGDTSAITVPYLGQLHVATLDPGIAAWLGYKGLDDGYAGNEGISLYRVVAAFRSPLAIGASPADLLALLAAPAVPGVTAADVLARIGSEGGPFLAAEGRSFTGALDPANDYLLMTAVALIDRRVPVLPPATPQGAEAKHSGWRPDAAPNLLRNVECTLSGILAGAVLAVGREQPVGGAFTRLNRQSGQSRWHLPLVIGQDNRMTGQLLSQSDPWQGTVTDRTAGPEGARYHVAQQDGFGRWSDHATIDAPPGVRPRPPRPVLSGHYTPPALADALTTGGAVALMVPLPEVEALAPAARPLSHLRFTLSHSDVEGRTPAVPMADVTVPASAAVTADGSTPPQRPRRGVPARTTGPVLQPTQQRKLTVLAYWVDTSGQVSDASEPLVLLMSDPRPPAQLSIPETLLYASRPDATGLAWIERAWQATSETARYAVYYTDEVRLLSWLKETNPTQAASIRAIEDRAQRAGLFRQMQASIPDYLFERLQDVVEAQAGGLARSFRHAVSGSSRVLNAYKIAAEAGQTGARPDLRALDTVFYAVPNADPPPRPKIDVRLVPALPGEPDLVTEVTITVESGVTSGRTTRIFRTRGSQADSLLAPVVRSVALPQPDPVTRQQVAVIRDTGPVQIAPAARLTGYTRYQYFAEVQGAPESGSSVSGLWSLPSDPVSIATIPLTVPATPAVALGGTPVPSGMQDLAITIDAQGGVGPTALGYWTFDLVDLSSAAQPMSIAAGEVTALPMTIRASASGQTAASGTRFKLFLRDPIGRPLRPVDLTVP